MSLGSFTLVRNEARWIAPHILRVLPFIDEMVFYDGNSTDGTREIIEEIASEHEVGYKIKLFTNKDPKDLQDDYVRLSNQCMHQLSTDLAWFLHPDMWVINPEQILIMKDSPAVCLSARMHSFGGEPDGKLYEMTGRGIDWKDICRIRNPDLGAHYHGHYGHTNEDVYFSEISGKNHVMYDDFNSYPYSIIKSGLEVMHFSDVRPLERRVSRMVRCLINNKWTKEEAEARAAIHPRVTLTNSEGYSFRESRYPGEFLAHQAQYKHIVKEPMLVNA